MASEPRLKRLFNTDGRCFDVAIVQEGVHA